MENIEYLHHLMGEINVKETIILPENFFEKFKGDLIITEIAGNNVYEFVIRENNKIKKLLTFETYKPIIRLIERFDLHPNNIMELSDEEFDISCSKSGIYNKKYVLKNENQ